MRAAMPFEKGPCPSSASSPYVGLARQAFPAGVAQRWFPVACHVLALRSPRVREAVDCYSVNPATVELAEECPALVEGSCRPQAGLRRRPLSAKLLGEACREEVNRERILGSRSSDGDPIRRKRGRLLCSRPKCFLRLPTEESADRFGLAASNLRPADGGWSPMVELRTTFIRGGSCRAHDSRLCVAQRRSGRLSTWRSSYMNFDSAREASNRPQPVGRDGLLRG